MKFRIGYSIISYAWKRKPRLIDEEAIRRMESGVYPAIPDMYAEKIDTVTTSSDVTIAIEQQLHELASQLKSRNVSAYDRWAATLVNDMSQDGKRDLSRALRSPKNAIGSMKDHSLWSKIDTTIESNRQVDEQKHRAE